MLVDWPSDHSHLPKQIFSSETMPMEYLPLTEGRVHIGEDTHIDLHEEHTSLYLPPEAATI
jgi:hypothetical protein